MGKLGKLARYSLLLIIAGTISAQPRRALIIGNDSYSFAASLKNARNDARSVDAALSSMGYSTILELDASRQAFESAVELFLDQLHAGDIALVYYSGHGIQIDGVNYLIPIDLMASGSEAIKTQGYSLSSLLAQIAAKRPAATTVILDACRNNPFIGQRSLRGGLAPLSPLSGIYLAFSTAPGATASDGPNEQHGAFTEALLKHIGEALPADEMFEEVRADVVRATNGTQIPWTSSSIIGTLGLNPSTEKAVEETSAVRQTAQTAGEQFNSDSQGGSTRSFVGNRLDGSNKRESANILVNASLQMVGLGNYDEAVRSLSSALALNPTSSLALRLLGIVFHLIGRSSQALEVLTRAIEVNPTDYSAYSYRALILTPTNPAAALRDCEAAMGLNQSFAPAQLGRAGAMLALGQFDEALRDVNELIALRPDYRLAYSLRGRVYAKQGKRQAAEQDFRRAIQLSSADGDN